MSSKWTTTTFGEVVTLQQGLCFNKKSNHLMAEVGLPLLRIADLINNTETKFVDAVRVPKRFVSAPQDIIYTRTGQVGLVFKGRIGVVHNNCFRILPKTGIERDYVFWFLKQPSVIQQARSLAGGAAQPDLGHGAFKSISFSYPDLATQRRIVGILSAYDELIENNRRRIEILEQMARALYREWFVEFRFPGHHKIPRVASSRAEIPEGWQVRKLADFVTTQYGYTESSNPEPVGPQYLRGMDINKTSYIDWSEVPYCPITSEDHAAYRLKMGDVVVIRMADPGKIGIVEQDVDAVFASYLIRVAPKDQHLSPYFLFFLLESAEYYAYITGASTGTTRKSASAGVVSDYQFVLPPQPLVLLFEERVKQIRSLLTTLLKQTVNLRRTRDLLLPRLLSGQIALEGTAAA
jgi:type I restriction enzyme S subunit